MRLAQEVDAVNGRVIIVVTAAAVAATAIGVLVAWLLSPPAPSPEHQVQRWGHPPEERNALEMAPFPRRTPRAFPSAARLREYGWADREAGTVHIPLERAKALYLARRRRAAAGSAPSTEGSP